MRLARRNKTTVARQAAEWTEVLKNADARDRAAFDEWLTESPQHAREFLLMSAVDRALDSVDPAREHSVEALLSQARNETVVAIDELPAAPSLARRRGTSRWAWAAAVGLAIVAVLGWWIGSGAPWNDVRTTIGEQRTLQLSDGSVIYLNTQSHLQVRLNSAAREVRLLEGQALFKVNRDGHRPFRVQAGDALIQALGTQFDVYRRPDASVTVAVVEGRVRVSSAPAHVGASTDAQQRPVLSAGEQLRLAPDGKVRERVAVNEASLMAWHERRLVFRRATLAIVVEEFNRYNRSPRFRVDDPAIADRHYSGEFDADDPGSLLQLLRTDPELAVVREGNEVAIRRR